MSPAQAVKFKRTEAKDLTLEVIEDDNTPKVTFEDARMADDHGGPVRLIQFTAGRPIFTLDNNKCLRIK